MHHARKGAGRARAGQALRGSSEFHAWTDSSLFLRRDGDALTLTIEHRAEPSHGPLSAQLVADGDALALTAEPSPAIATDPTDLAETPADRIALEVAEGRIIVSSSFLQIGGYATWVLVVLANLSMMIAAALYTRSIAVRYRVAQRALLLRAWHLEQLLPEGQLGAHPAAPDLS